MGDYQAVGNSKRQEEETGDGTVVGRAGRERRREQQQDTGMNLVYGYTKNYLVILCDFED